MSSLFSPAPNFSEGQRVDRFAVNIIWEASHGLMGHGPVEGYIQEAEVRPLLSVLHQCSCLPCTCDKWQQLLKTDSHHTNTCTGGKIIINHFSFAILRLVKFCFPELNHASFWLNTADKCSEQSESSKTTFNNCVCRVTYNCEEKLYISEPICN